MYLKDIVRHIKMYQSNNNIFLLLFYTMYNNSNLYIKHRYPDNLCKPYSKHIVLQHNLSSMLHQILNYQIYKLSNQSQHFQNIVNKYYDIFNIYYQNCQSINLDIFQCIYLNKNIILHLEVIIHKLNNLLDLNHKFCNYYYSMNICYMQI